MNSEETKKKFVDKSLYKATGKLLEAKKVAAYTWEFILWKNVKDKVTGKTKKKYVKFNTSHPECVSVLSSAERDHRFKVKFKIESTLFKERWYTNLTCVSISDWIVNEDKLKREAYFKNKQVEMFDNNEYNKSIINFGNQSEQQ